jgi:hypothetical protein
VCLANVWVQYLVTEEGDRSAITQRMGRSINLCSQQTIIHNE